MSLSLSMCGLVEPGPSECIAPTVDDTMGAVGAAFTIHYAGFTYISPRSLLIAIVALGSFRWASVHFKEPPADAVVSRFLLWRWPTFKVVRFKSIIAKLTSSSLSTPFMCVCMLIWLQCSASGANAQAPSMNYDGRCHESANSGGLSVVVRVGHVYLWSTYT